jgi:predicted RND superfamily exporter protein
MIDFVSKEKSVEKIEHQRLAFNFITHKVDDPLARKMVQTEFEHSKFAERYLSSSRDERVILYLKTTNTQKLNELRSSVAHLCPEHECWVGGEIIAFADFSRSLIHTLFDSFFLSLVLVAIVLAYLAWASGKHHYFSLIIASFWGPAVILCLIYAFDLSINFVTCIIASTLVGLTGDNAIQFIFASKENSLEKGIEERGPSSLYCALTMGLCSLVFLGSYFEAPKVLGVLLAAGFFFSLIGDVWILNGLTPKKKE